METLVGLSTSSKPFYWYGNKQPKKIPTGAISYHVRGSKREKAPKQCRRQVGFRDWELTLSEKLAQAGAETPGSEGPAHDRRLQRQDTRTVVSAGRERQGKGGFGVVEGDSLSDGVQWLQSLWREKYLKFIDYNICQ